MNRSSVCFVPRAVRGMSLSVLLALVIPALIVALGLAVDGGRQLAAQRQAQALAAQAARAGAEAWSSRLLAGDSDGQVAIEAANGVLVHHLELSAQVSVDNGRTVLVTVDGDISTLFLTLIGVHDLPIDGAASADVHPYEP